jgi:hypothetical protein
MMKMFVLIMTLFVFRNAICQTSETVASKLATHDWQVASEVIAMVSQNADSIGTLPEVRKGVADLFHRETQYFRDPSSGSMNKLTGETEGEAAFLVVKLDLKKALPDLLDWCGSSPVFRKYILKNMVASSDCKSPLVDSLGVRFGRSGVFYEMRQLDYFMLACNLVDSLNGCVSINKRLQARIPTYLSSSNDFDRLRAAQCACHSSRDTAVNNKLQQLSTSDPYVRIKNGKKTYPVREAAQTSLNCTTK